VSSSSYKLLVQGGVTFGENGSLTGEAVAREGEKAGASLISDRLYIEAEKLAIDVRDDSKAKEGGGGSQMMFGFFDEPANTSTTAAAPVSAPVRSVGEDSERDEMVEEQEPSYYGEEDAETISERFVLPSLFSVIADAVSFQRDA
jgi:hypothetical protein